MATTPVSVFLQWLGNRARDCRVAVAVDGDLLLTDAGILGKPAIADDAGRTWQVVVFRGDDLAFRMRFRVAQNQEPVVIVLTGNRSGAGVMDLSWIADILALNEGGTPLDLSLPAFFRRLMARCACLVKT